MSTIARKKLLYEVSIIRPLVIFLLVTLHSFTKITSGGGGYYNDYSLIGLYKWITWLILGFRIETIALIAGYVFAYQSIDLNKKYELKPFVLKKFKRLIIPMLVFGVVYYFLFYFNPEDFDYSRFVISLLSGCGHLWFLPMLFWCFIAVWIIDHYKLSSASNLIILAFISIVPFPELPFGFARLPHFVFYVIFGYFLYTRRDYIISGFLQTKYISLLWLLYITLVVLVHTILPEVKSFSSILYKGFIIGINNGVKLLMTLSGIMALYLTVCNFTTRKQCEPQKWIINASNNCYGIYVYHQFILVLLYFFTPIVAICNPLMVPWIGLVMSLLISWILTKLTLKTKIGRYLIG